jgi:dynein heavy chain 1, cytosolic
MRSFIGTGKTESVKALGHALGRFVLVFNCDESFDFQVDQTLAHVRHTIGFICVCFFFVCQAMGRLFTGLCQVGE